MPPFSPTEMEILTKELKKVVGKGIVESRQHEKEGHVSPKRLGGLGSS